MGHKVNPIALRIGFIKNWQSMWFAKHAEFSKCIEEDYRIRKFIKKNFKQAAISKIIIERLAQRVRIRIHTARPGIIIGRHGADIERLRGDLNGMLNREVSIDIEEVKDPSLDAQLISENVALQLEKRVAYRRAIKRVIEQAMSAGAQGVRIVCAGRLGGAEMSRKETYKQGKIPLQTLRADIDYGFAEALTTYGLIGIKTWVYKGDILFSKDKEKVAVEEAAEDKDKKAKEASESKEAPAA
jgi:small subunit ribosomal protein S3